MTSENGSYIVQSTSTTPKNIQQGGCMVKICPLNKDVCRIRYDLDVSIKSIIVLKILIIRVTFIIKDQEFH